METTQTFGSSIALGGDSSPQWGEAEFCAVFVEYYPRIVAILARLLGDRSRAEEVANDAFWRLYNRAGFRKDDNVGGWLYRTATNLAIDALRSAARRRQYETAAGQLGAGEAAGPLDHLLREEKCRQVRAALSAVRPPVAQLLILRSAGLSYKQLAAALEVKTSGIGAMLNRAEDEFRKRYLSLFPDEEAL
ncbi:MAG: sigma-70 family RNA polymerase sigma factor [Acidobacteria bacterium]|nr:sigma-70 family RNA polymerase sigma factor [Acidobacteriota bacterium]MBV9625683.1 sigma-70 family RNA polymerase sigma factor [Acidobacteriota bacterium]